MTNRNDFLILEEQLKVEASVTDKSAMDLKFLELISTIRMKGLRQISNYGTIIDYVPRRPKYPWIIDRNGRRYKISDNMANIHFKA